MDRPSRTKSHPAGSLSSSHPGGPPWWTRLLDFGLTGCDLELNSSKNSKLFSVFGFLFSVYSLQFGYLSINFSKTKLHPLLRGNSKSFLSLFFSSFPSLC
jgi:hypothetical protein